MPIYAYRCAACGHAKDVLQKISDPVLNVCPACGADTFRKQLTAAGFQLKGSGWYATDFKGGGKPPAATPGADDKPADGKPADGKPAEGKPAEGKPADAAAPAAAPAPAPTGGSGSGGSPAAASGSGPSGASH